MERDNWWLPAYRLLGPNRLGPRTPCEFSRLLCCDVLCCVVLLRLERSFVSRIPGSTWTRRGLMLRAVPCLFSERWRERRTTARHRQFAGPWLAGACCCRGLCRHGEGRGRGGGATIKRTATVSTAPLRRGKQRGEVAGSRGHSTLKTARIYSFTENKLVFFCTPPKKGDPFPRLLSCETTSCYLDK